MRDGRRRVAAVLVVAAVAVVAAGGISRGGAATTEAAWQRPSYATATVSTGTLQPVPAVACGAAGGLLAVSIPITWTAPATGPTPTGYIVAWAGAAGTGQNTATGTSGTVPGGALSVLGSSVVTVTGTYGLWRSPVSLKSLTVSTVSVAGIIVSWTCTANP